MESKSSDLEQIFLVGGQTDPGAWSPSDIVEVWSMPVCGTCPCVYDGRKACNTDI